MMNKTFAIHRLGVSLIALSFLLWGCSNIDRAQVNLKPTIAMTEENQTAKVTAVQATGASNKYTFAVTVNSPDTGCDRYADWWEVITPEGELVYRRVLLHSHVDEQPFKRTGGKVEVTPEQEVIVRVHMSDSGYSPNAQQGTVKSGFESATLESDFGNDLKSVEPLPSGCAF